MKKLVLVLVLALTFPVFCDAFALNVTSDLHAGKQSKRDKGDEHGIRNITYPKKWKGNFKNFIKDQADLYLILGDNINGSKKDYKFYREMRKIVDKSNREALFVKGNHDTNKKYNYLSAKKYYSIDKDNWRVIVLDTNEDSKISQTQLDWLKEELKTDKKVLIAMHEPPFEVNSHESVSAFHPFLEMVKNNDNIKYVLSGHSHLSESKTVDGYEAEFITVQPLTLKGRVGEFLKLDLE